MKKVLSLLIIVLVIGCAKKEESKPKVIYPKPSQEKEVVSIDTTEIEIADLPIHMEGTNFLIHPIGKLSKDKRDAYDSRGSYTISNYGEFQITGYLKNLKFQEIGKDTLIALTDKPILIETATYLKELAAKSKQQLLLYSLADADTNQDGKLDSNDVKALYISTISGQRFTKLSPEFQELVDWEILESQNLLYFRTLEDTNKNGQFDAKDNLQYYFINLSSTDWKVNSYKPVE